MKKGVERIDYVIQRNSKSGEAEAGDGQLPSRFCNHSQENRSKNKQSHTALHRSGFVGQKTRHNFWCIDSRYARNLSNPIIKRISEIARADFEIILFIHYCIINKQLDAKKISITLCPADGNHINGNEQQKLTMMLKFWQFQFANNHYRRRKMTDLTN